MLITAVVTGLVLVTAILAVRLAAFVIGVGWGKFLHVGSAIPLLVLLGGAWVPYKWRIRLVVILVGGRRAIRFQITGIYGRPCILRTGLGTSN